VSSAFIPTGNQAAKGAVILIAFLRGILASVSPDSIIIEVSGIGYEVQIHTRTQTLLPAVGIPLLVHTYLQVLDNDLKLFGFLNREELELGNPDLFLLSIFWAYSLVSAGRFRL